MSIKKKLVLVSSYFPPYNHIASRRIYAFANYLSDFFEVTVITHTENESYNEKNDKYIDKLLDRINALEHEVHCWKIKNRKHDEEEAIKSYE